MHNAFKVLDHKGFLRDVQGIMTLEAVQKLYEKVSDDSGEAPFYMKLTMVEKDLLDFCQPGVIPDKIYQPVVIIKPANGTEHANHAVALKEYSNNGKTLTLTLMDSLAKNGETIIKARNQNLTKIFSQSTFIIIYKRLIQSVSTI